MPKKLGIYDPSRVPSGTSRYADLIIAGIDPEEFDVVVFGDAEGPFVGREGIAFVPVTGQASRGSIVPITDVPNPKRRPSGGWRGVGRRVVPKPVRLWAGFGRNGRRLAAQFRARLVDLLHTNNTGCEESAIAARLAGVPRVLGTFHVDSTYDLQGVRSGLRHRLLERLSNRCLHRAIAVSEATKADWVRRTGIPPGRVVTIPNGVDPDAFRRRVSKAEARARLGLPREGGVLIGGVGRLDEAKGFADLIEAFALLTATDPRAELAIAGTGPLREGLAARAAALGVADRVHFLGFRPDVRDVFEALDVFALSSLCEAMPYALLEAMAAGLPAVGTRVGGVAEVIEAGETGFVVPPREPAAMASALRPLVESSELRDRLGAEGRERVEREFHVRDTVRRTVDVYREMIGAAPAWASIQGTKS